MTLDTGFESISSKDSSAHGDLGLPIIISLPLLATVAVMLRIIARRQRNKRLAIDDWLIILALAVYYALTGLGIWGVVLGGYGYWSDVTLIPLDFIELYLKIYYFNSILFMSTIELAKLSFLCLLHRIFVAQIFRRWVMVTGIVSLLFWASVEIASIVQCIPIEATWDKSMPGRCFDYDLYVVIGETINCLLCTIIVMMPWAVIRHLQIPRRQKISIGLIFLIGGFVNLMSVVRIVYIWNPLHAQTSYLNNGKWADLQMSSAIIGACLPTYKALLPLVSKPLDRLSAHWKPQDSHSVKDPLTAMSRIPVPV